MPRNLPKTPQDERQSQPTQTPTEPTKSRPRPVKREKPPKPTHEETFFWESFKSDCARYDLYVMTEGSGKQVNYVFYSKDNGRALMTYSPKKKRWWKARMSDHWDKHPYMGHAEDHHHAVLIAAAIKRGKDALYVKIDYNKRKR